MMRSLLLTLALLALPGPRLCAQGAPPRATAVDAPEPGTARLRVGDAFDLRLGGAPAQFTQEFSGPYTVAQDGSVNVPYIGEIKAAGLTSTQLERAIQTRLVGGKIFTTPTVIISLSQVARFVSVTGGVRAPSRVQWTPALTLTTAISGAGGFGEFARQKGIRIIRGGQVIGTYNWKDVNLDPTRDPKVLPGDQVNVPE